MAKTVLESNVMSRWGFLVLGYKEHENRFFDLVTDKLTEYGWSQPVNRVDVGGGLLSLSGRETRRYLETRQGKLTAYVATVAIGDDTYISWCLAMDDPGLTKRAVAVGLSFSPSIFQTLAFNEVDNARAFATFVHHCVQEAVDMILDGEGIDKTKVSREATGILGTLV